MPVISENSIHPSVRQWRTLTRQCCSPSTGPATVLEFRIWLSPRSRESARREVAITHATPGVNRLAIGDTNTSTRELTTDLPSSPLLGSAIRPIVIPRSDRYRRRLTTDVEHSDAYASWKNPDGIVSSLQCLRLTELATLSFFLFECHCCAADMEHIDSFG